jgi:hypothetical protein
MGKRSDMIPMTPFMLQGVQATIIIAWYSIGVQPR